MLSLIFSSTKKHNIVKIISVWTESTLLLLFKPLKKYSFRDTIPLKPPFSKLLKHRYPSSFPLNPSSLRSQNDVLTQKKDRVKGDKIDVN